MHKLEKKIKFRLEVSSNKLAIVSFQYVGVFASLMSTSKHPSLAEANKQAWIGF